MTTINEALLGLCTHAEPVYSAHQRLHAHQRQHHLPSTPPSYCTDRHTTDRQHLVL